MATNPYAQQQLESKRNEIYRYELFGKTPGFQGYNEDQYNSAVAELGLQGKGAGTGYGQVISGLQGSPATSMPSLGTPAAAPSGVQTVTNALVAKQQPQVQQSLADQIRAKWGSTGDWNQGGIDRASELAAILSANDVTNLSDLSFNQYKWTPDVQILTGDAGDGSYLPNPAVDQIQASYGGRALGYLGDFNNDGTVTAGPAWADGDPVNRGDQKAIAWSARGHGNVSFVPVKDPNTGEVVIRPVWGSSKQGTYDDIRGLATVAAAALGGYYGLEGSALGASEAAGLSGLDAAALDMAGSSGSMFGGVGAGAGSAAGATGMSAAEQAAFLEANAGAMAPGAGMPGAATYNALQPYVGTELASGASGLVNASSTLGVPPGSTTAAQAAASGGGGSAAQTAATTAAQSAAKSPFSIGGVPVKDILPIAGAAATLASGGKASTPAVPDYVKQAIATSNAGKYNEVTPYGTIGWSLRPGADPANPQPGDYIRTTNFSPEQQALYEKNTANQLQAGQVGGNMLADLGGGRQAVQDALYRRATQYYDQRYGDQEAQLRTRLANQGLNEGSEAFDRELRNFRQTRDTAYADATDRAISGANQQENDAVARIVNILNLSRATNPTSGNSAGGAGTDLLSAANQAYTANLGATNAQNAANAQQQQALLQLVLGGMQYYGG